MTDPTALQLNDRQTLVVERLKALPGARVVTVHFEVDVLLNGITRSTMRISGGCDGPAAKPCKTCDQSKHGAAYLDIELFWRNDRYEKARISQTYGIPRPYCFGRPREVSLTRALGYAEKFAQEHCQVEVDA